MLSFHRFHPRNQKISLSNSSPGMWDFTKGFLSSISSQDFSQIFYSFIMIKPRFFKNLADHHELVVYMLQIRLSCYYFVSCMNLRTLAMYFFSSWITHAKLDSSVFQMYMPHFECVIINYLCTFQFACHFELSSIIEIQS